MSLISDALKKARQEAARQDALRQGVPYAVGAAEAPERRAPWISLLAGLGAGCVLAAIVFAVAFFAGWGPFHKPAAATRMASVEPAAPAPPAAVPSAPAMNPQAAPPPAPVAVTPAPEPPRRPLEPPSEVVQEPPVRHPVPVPEAAPPAPAKPPASPPPAEAEHPAPAPAVPAAPPKAAPTAPSADAGELVDGKIYAGEVPLPGGGSVKLNGIAFSTDHPVAVIDGRVMGPGESIQGFTLTAIESGRVTLQGHGATVFLSPR